MKVKELLTSWQKTIEKLEKAQSGLSERLETIAAQLQDNPEAASRLRSELTALQDKLGKVTAQLEEAQKEREFLTKQLQGLQSSSDAVATQAIATALGASNDARQKLKEKATQKRAWM